jgi:ribosomal protein L40E
MYHTAGYIEGKQTDFKVCKKCDEINWYENESCHNCRSYGTTSKAFRAVTKLDIKRMLEWVKEDRDYEVRTG